MAEDEIRATFDIRDDRFHDHVYAVLDELTHNATHHSPPGRKEARVSVDHDEIGMFVEVASISDRDQAEYVRDFVERHKTLSDAALLEEEIATFRRNMGTGRGGVGLFQVIRSALSTDLERLIFVETAPSETADLMELTVRVYVSTDTGGNRRDARSI
ncbi:hypothetical protein M4578_06295 [Salipiger sp. P9]|uniref:hypothetical protein n=1 Tax=Salipiger pentaromativorans TaxID=2943193 RepID=UPI00215851C9|nr:hypothetical protein [Salipiger pentaromativorans]MCR8547430.1 hypothetical protein [Salipiger pentaromativorans]